MPQNSPSASAASTETEIIAKAAELVERALKAGAERAEAIVLEGTSLGVSWRMGKLEDVERSEGRDVGLRVFIGQRQAVVSTTDLSERSVAPLIERVVAMARVAPEDPYAGLADPALLARDSRDLEIDDPAPSPSAEHLAERAAEAEEAALAIPGVTNSGGAGAQWGRSRMALVTSGGFSGSYAGTSYSISVSALAGQGTQMERDYEHSSTRYQSDADAPISVGRAAGEKAVRRLNPRKVKSQSVPVIYDPRVSGGLLGHFASAISGASVARRASFLQQAMGTKIFADGIDIIDDPHRLRGLRSKPFDGEGVRNQAMKLIDDGTLTTWLLDTTSAKQLGLASAGHASRGTSGPSSPSTTNLYMLPGKLSPEDLIADIDEGFYVTELIGMGVNGITGDYSRGASGFWIEKGKLAYPVSEITIAGHMKEMFLHATPASDLAFKYATNAPTLRIEGMIVAGT